MRNSFKRITPQRGYSENMKFSSLLKRPLKFTVITVAIASVLFVIFSMTVAYLDRIINSPGTDALCIRCFSGANGWPLLIGHGLAYDLRTLAGYTVELGILFLITQIIYRISRR